MTSTTSRRSPGCGASAGPWRRPLRSFAGGGVEADALSACGAVGADLAALSSEYARQLEAARLADLPELYRLAAAVVAAPGAGRRAPRRAGGPA